MSVLAINDVSMAFTDRRGNSFVALDRITLDVEQSEFVCLIGHSGCGKSTLLNLAAGLLLPTSGTITCSGKRVTGPGPDRAMVFQSHALLPWLTCFENVFLAAKQVFPRLPDAELSARANHALKMVHLESASAKYQYEISGGMKQRVGIARAFAVEPKVLLLDEPFGALDALTKASLQDELVQIVAQLRTTVLMVTHDIDEAIFLADRIVALRNGPASRIGQIWDVASPRPRNRVDMAADPTSVKTRKAILEFLYDKTHTQQTA